MPGVGTTHHIRLGDHYYMIRPNTYMKKAAPQFGARFTTGDPDFNNLSLWQHWAQKCFIGGFDQDLWQDDAMYDEGIGLDTTDHEKVRLSRDLTRGSGSNWVLSSATATGGEGGKFIVYNSKLYFCTFATTGTESRLWEYVPGSDGWTNVTSLASKNITARSVAVYDGKLFIGGNDSGTGAAKVIYDDGALTSWTTLANPSGITSATGFGVRAMMAFQSKFYIAYGVRIWRFKSDQTPDGNTVFYAANASSSSNAIIAMEIHLGFMYMLSKNGHVHRTDGNSTFDIWNWDGQTEGVSIRSFDGRLFIMTFEYTNTTDVGWGVLYQMSGSAMTQLKRFGNDTSATRIGNMRAYDRRLFYGASNLLGFGGGRLGFGVAAYDPVEDAHSVMCTNSDTVSFVSGVAPYANYVVDDQFFFGGYLFVYVRGHGGLKTPYKYRDAIADTRFFDVSAAGPSLLPLNGGWLTTSTYDAGTPGVKKLWRKIVIDAEILTGTGIVVEYSTTNGNSWTTAQTVSTVGDRRQFEVYLDNVIATSFKLRLTLRSTVQNRTPVLYGYVVSYMPVPEPNWMWSFTIVLAEKMQLLDNTNETVDTEAEIDYLNDLYRAKALVHFTDAEGVAWTSSGGHGALIYDITYNLRDLNQPLEGDVTVTILEAVETY